MENTSNKQNNKENIIEFGKLIKEFLLDINICFSDIFENIKNHKDYKVILENDIEDLILNSEENNNKIVFDAINNLYNFCIDLFPKHFFNILYQNEEMFTSKKETELLPQIYFSEIYYDTTSKETKETIWKYLQCILFSIVTNVEDNDSFGVNNKLFEVINQDEFKKKLEDTVNDLGDVFKKCKTSNIDNNNTNTNNTNNDTNNNKENFDFSDFKNFLNNDNSFNFENIFNNIDNSFNFKEIFDNLENLENLDNSFNFKEMFDEKNNDINFEELFNNFKNFTKSQNNFNENNSNDETNNNLPDIGNIHDHINNLINGKIGSLAKELAEETTKDLNLDLENENINSVGDVFSKLFKNPNKLMNLVNNIGSKIDNKIKDGSIKESELLEEASSMLKNMKSMPGMGNFEDILKSMNMDKFMPKGGKFNNNAFENMMNQNIKISKMKERMKKKAEQNKSNNINSANDTNYTKYEKNYNENNKTQNLKDLNSNLESLMQENEYISNILKDQQFGLGQQQSVQNTETTKKKNKKKNNRKK